MLFGHQRTGLSAGQARGLEITAGSLSDRPRRRPGRGSRSGAARISTPTLAIPVRGLVRLATTPHSAVNTVIVVLLLIDHADKVRAARVLDEPVQLLTGPGHQLATARVVSPAQLAGHRIWMPELVPGTEWAAFYDKLAASFGLTIDVTSPDFGTETLLDTIAASSSLATLVGEQTRITWAAEWDLRCIAVRDPVPVYPHALIWRADNPHPALTALRGYLGPPRSATPGTWAPGW
jgi:LysR substrate binding domain-containing protein